jgi:hypothetical protein
MRNLSMKKFGTPIGAAPGSAIDVVGLAIVGSPPRRARASAARRAPAGSWASSSRPRTRCACGRSTGASRCRSCAGRCSRRPRARRPRARRRHAPPRGRGRDRPARVRAARGLAGERRDLLGRQGGGTRLGRRGRRGAGGSAGGAVWATGAGRASPRRRRCRLPGSRRRRRPRARATVDVDRHDEHAPVGQRDLEGAHLRAGGRTAVPSPAVASPARPSATRFWDA